MAFFGFPCSSHMTIVWTGLLNHWNSQDAHPCVLSLPSTGRLKWTLFLPERVLSLTTAELCHQVHRVANLCHGSTRGAEDELLLYLWYWYHGIVGCLYICVSWIKVNSPVGCLDRCLLLWFHSLHSCSFTRSTSPFPRKNRTIQLFLASKKKKKRMERREANFSWIFGQVPCFYSKCLSYNLGK